PTGSIGPYTVEWSGWAGVPSHGLVPGARVEGQVKRRRRDRLDARVLSVLSPGPEAVEPRCAHFASCGGCTMQDSSYAGQLRALGDGLRRALEPVIGSAVATVEVEPAPDVFGYRNKMDFTFANRRWVEAGAPDDDTRPDDFALGLHVAGRFEKVLDVTACSIQFEGADALLSDIRSLAMESGQPAWDVREHTGFWRHAVLRQGRHTGQTMVHLVTASVGEDPERRSSVDRLVGALVDRRPELTTVVHTQTDRLSTVAAGETVDVLHGPGVITDQLRGVQFEISAQSFFQTNTLAAERMLGWIDSRLEDETGGTLFDLYCGAGAIGLTLARRFDSVVGIELVEAAVEDARRNARANGIEHAEFHAGDVPVVLEQGAFGTVELAVVDPPRAGLHPKFVDALLASPPRRSIYVSCNPVAAARDLERLTEVAYEVRAMHAFDLFPHTPHVETVFDLVRRS
ncbi:MAG: 23S rRNA (uracil(1939)-C(5))-methyltransferase RlmD, partial [Planctomycetota bacterium]